jgi:hypothetical protein
VLAELTEEDLCRMHYRPTKAGYAALAAGTASWMTLAEIVNAQLSQPIPNEPIEGA